jgi:hypothetical protein
MHERGELYRPEAPMLLPGRDFNPLHHLSYMGYELRA